MISTADGILRISSGKYKILASKYEKKKIRIRIELKFFRHDLAVFPKWRDISSYTHSVTGKPREFLMQIVQRFRNTLVNSNKIQSNVLQRFSVFKYLLHGSEASRMMVFKEI